MGSRGFLFAFWGYRRGLFWGDIAELLGFILGVGVILGVRLHPRSWAELSLHKGGFSTYTLKSNLWA